MRFGGALALILTSLAVTSVAVSASGQAVIAAHSGVIHFVEGSVYVNDQPLETHLGRFAFLEQGAELRTEQGRAEMLLTPGVILRLDQDSAVRMISNSLDDTRVELLKGSAIVDSGVPESGTCVTLLYRDWQVAFPQKGVYRVDSAPAQVWVRDGVAKVSDASGNPPVAVGAGTDLPLAAALVPEQTVDEPLDAFYNWDRGREDSISADNQIAANIQDPGSLPDASLGDLASDGFTQFPMIGLAPVSPAAPSGVYGPGLYNSSLYPYQPGFYSMYLPGYTFYPSLFLSIPPTLLRSSIYGRQYPGISPLTVPRPLIVGRSPALGGNRTVLGGGAPVFVGSRPVTAPSMPVSRPVTPIARPAAPMARPAAPHIGGHR